MREVRVETAAGKFGQKITIRAARDRGRRRARGGRRRHRAGAPRKLTGDQKARLLEIAEKCPVARTLRGEITIATRLAGAAAA